MAAVPQDGALFARFRIGNDSDDAPRQPKRQRKIHSCSHCYRSKVKCDRNRPCARCVSTGRANECTFSSTPASSPPPNRQQQRPLQQYSSPQAYYTGESAVRTGLTHWANVISEVGCCPRASISADVFLHSSRRPVTTSSTRNPSFMKLSRAWRSSRNCIRHPRATISLSAMAWQSRRAPSSRACLHVPPLRLLLTIT